MAVDLSAIETRAVTSGATKQPESTRDALSLQAIAELLEGLVWTPVRQHTTSADMQSGADITTAPTTGQKIVLDDLVVSSASALTITFTEETSGTVVLTLYVAAGGTAIVPLRNGLKLATANKKLRAASSGAGALSIHASWHSQA